MHLINYHGILSDWMRIGAFTFDSRVAFLTKKLHDPLRIPRDTIINDTLKAAGACLLRNVKPGIWIAGYSYMLSIPILFITIGDCNLSFLLGRQTPVLYFECGWCFRSTACSMPCLPTRELRRLAVCFLNACNEIIYQILHLWSIVKCAHCVCLDRGSDQVRGDMHR